LKRSSRERSKSGFTLIDVLVGGVIMLVVMFVMFQLLVPSMTMFRSQMAFSQAHQSSLMAVQKIKREMTNTAVSTLTINPTTYAFSFAPKDESAPFTTKGETRFRKIFIVYFLKDDKLFRKFYPYGSDSIPPVFGGPNPPALSLSHLNTAADTTNGTERVMASRVSHFQVIDGGADGVLIEPPIVVELTCSVPTDSEKVEEYEVRLEVSPRSMEW
jgi:hypothetical protein